MRDHCKLVGGPKAAHFHDAIRECGAAETREQRQEDPLKDYPPVDHTTARFNHWLAEAFAGKEGIITIAMASFSTPGSDKLFTEESKRRAMIKVYEATINGLGVWYNEFGVAAQAMAVADELEEQLRKLKLKHEAAKLADKYREGKRQ